MSELEDLQKDLQAVSAGLQEFAEHFLRKGSAQIAARSVTKYMRDTGGREGRRSPDNTGPLRIVQGRLARSLSTRGRNVDTGGQPEGIMKIQVARAMVKLIKGSEVPYARPHEHGYRGKQLVSAHTRRITQAFGQPIEPKDVTVRSHTRMMELAKRAYLHPALQDKLPMLEIMATVDLERYLLKHLS